MQSSSSALPFKQNLAGASPATDAKLPNASCPRSSIRLERHRAKVEVAGAIPAVDAILLLCLSSDRTSFVNSNSSVTCSSRSERLFWATDSQDLGSPSGWSPQLSMGCRGGLGMISNASTSPTQAIAACLTRSGSKRLCRWESGTLFRN